MHKGKYEYLPITDLKDMLDKTGKLYANNVAYQIRKKDNTYEMITHQEVREQINALGTALIDMGLKNKRIAVIGENRYEWEIAYLAIVCGTGIVVPFDKSLPENELKSVIERSNIEAIIYSKKYEETLKKMKFQGVGNLKHLISMDLECNQDGIYSQKELIEKGKKLLQNGDTRFTGAKINPEEMSIMLFTSGTTAASKIVALSHHNICSNLMGIASVLDIDSSDTFLSFLPIHHVFECTVGFLFALYKGAKTVFCDGVRHIVENVKEYQITVMACVPAVYERIFKIIRKQLEKQGKLQAILENEEKYKDCSMEEKRKIFQEIHDMLGGKIRWMISGAASLDAVIEDSYRKLGLNLVQGYGLTETSPVVAIATKENYKLGSIGKTIPNVEAKLVDCNEEGIGELVVKGPNVMLEYFGNPEATRKVMQDGWFYTGDLAKIDKDGFIFICGRKKSVIVLKNGKNIFPEEMEHIINKIEGVEESFIYGKQMSEDKNDIKIFAKIVYQPETMKEAYQVDSKQEMKQILNEKVKEINKTMPIYKAIKGSIFTTEPLIKTTTNKLKRQANLEQILQEEKNSVK